MSKRKPSPSPKTIKPSEIRSRDPLIVGLINGATKSGVQKDRRKEASKNECRKKLRREDHE